MDKKRMVVAILVMVATLMLPCGANHCAEDPYPGCQATQDALQVQVEMLTGTPTP